LFDKNFDELGKIKIKFW